MSKEQTVVATRIAFVITELDVGGAEKALCQLVTSLPRDDWEPRVYCLGPQGPLSLELQRHGVPVTHYDGKGWPSGPRVLWQLTRDFRRFRPEIVQTFLFHANFLGRLAARFAGVSNVVSGVRVAEKRRRFHGWLDRWTDPLVRYHVCVSRSVAEFCATVTKLPRHKLVVIPNGVDSQRFQNAQRMDPTQFGLPASANILLTIGRLDRQKGIDLLIDSAVPIVQKHGDVHYVVLGKGSERQSLQQQIEAAELQDRFHLLGFSADVPGWLAAATALLLPSRWEGMPNVVLEAMAAGCPVVATQVEGIAELLTDHVSGWIVPSESATALTEVTDKLLRQEHLAADFAKSAQEIVQQRFRTSAIVAQYTSLYRTVLAKSTKSIPDSPPEKIS